MFVSSEALAGPLCEQALAVLFRSTPPVVRWFRPLALPIGCHNTHSNQPDSTVRTGDLEVGRPGVRGGSD